MSGYLNEGDEQSATSQETVISNPSAIADGEKSRWRCNCLARRDLSSSAADSVEMTG